MRTFVLLIALLALTACGDTYIVQPGADVPPAATGDDFRGDTNGNVVVTFPMADNRVRGIEAAQSRGFPSLYLACDNPRTVQRAINNLAIAQLRGTGVNDALRFSPAPTTGCRANRVIPDAVVRWLGYARTTDNWLVSVWQVEQAGFRFFIADTSVAQFVGAR